MCFVLSLYSFCISRYFFFKQKPAYDMRISDWSSDVCSSDLWQKSTSDVSALRPEPPPSSALHRSAATQPRNRLPSFGALSIGLHSRSRSAASRAGPWVRRRLTAAAISWRFASHSRSEEHTSELQSL